MRCTLSGPSASQRQLFKLSLKHGMALSMCFSAGSRGLVELRRLIQLQMVNMAGPLIFFLLQTTTEDYDGKVEDAGQREELEEGELEEEEEEAAADDDEEEEDDDAAVATPWTGLAKIPVRVCAGDSLLPS
jgi:hypothetical protein